MNILYICGYEASYAGNFIASIFALHDTVAGENACILLPAGARNREWISEITEHGIHVFYKAEKWKEEYKIIKFICSKYSIDIVYHHFYNLGDCIATRLLCWKWKNLKYVIHWHNEYKVSDSSFREALKKWIFHADMHIGCGEQVARELEQAGYQKVYAVNNGIDFYRLENWTKLLFGNGLNLLIFSSCSYEIKGIDIAIRAVIKCRKKYSDIELIVVAAAQIEEIKKKIIGECGGEIPEWIMVLPGREDVASFYHSVDAYLNASRSEGFCYASVEAVYCGAQVIQSDIPGNRLDIPGTYIFESENVESLAEEILQFRIEKEKDSSIRLAQKEYVEKKYGMKQWSKTICGLLEECCGNCLGGKR